MAGGTPNLLTTVLDELREIRKSVDATKDFVVREVAAVKSDVAVLLDDRLRAGDQRQRTYNMIEDVEKRTRGLELGLSANTVMCANMQADVGHISQRLDRVEQRGQQQDLMEERRLGMWDVIKRLGWLGWTVISGAVMLFMSGMVSLGVNWIGPALMAWWGH